jgi:hypothetical protein|tara:strand:- start:1367 stop:1681 length:315 start_codon:yes stop_codon:yes gene_type:complete
MTLLPGRSGTLARFTARRGAVPVPVGTSETNFLTSAFCPTPLKSASTPSRFVDGTVTTTVGRNAGGTTDATAVISLSNSAAKSSSLPLDEPLIARRRLWCRVAK